jgi:hypothetical protein
MLQGMAELLELRGSDEDSQLSARLGRALQRMAPSLPSLQLPGSAREPNS